MEDFLDPKFIEQLAKDISEMYHQSNTEFSGQTAPSEPATNELKTLLNQQSDRATYYFMHDPNKQDSIKNMSSATVNDKLNLDKILRDENHLSRVLSSLPNDERSVQFEKMTNGLLKDQIPRLFEDFSRQKKLDQESQSEYYFASNSLTMPMYRNGIDVHEIRKDFPVLHQKVHGKPLIWFDNAATTQKPQSVIDALSDFYENYNSNIHRGAHLLAARATDAYEEGRTKVQRFLNAESSDEIVFVRGTTEGINLVAQTYGRQYIGAGDEIILTTLEHHSNIVPWQMLAREKGAIIRVVPLSDSGEILFDEYMKLLGPRTRFVALSHVSNALGTVVPVREMIEAAHHYDAPVLVDGAQSVAHMPVDVQALDSDFYVLSGHKLFGPTGVGALHGKKSILDDMPPWQGGGSMIRDVTFEETVYNDPPEKFEAGTGMIAGAIGLGKAIDYVSRIGLHNIAGYEHELTQYASNLMSQIPGLRQIGTAPNKVGVLSFVLEGIPVEEVGRRLDQEGIAVRAGHHCAQPAMRHYGLESTVRPSLAFYNTFEEIDKLIEEIRKIRNV